MNAAEPRGFPGYGEPVVLSRPDRPESLVGVQTRSSAVSRLLSLLLLTWLGVGLLNVRAERIEFRGPRPVTYELESALPRIESRRAGVSPRVDWIRARRDGAGPVVEFGRRVVLRLTGTQLPAGLPGLQGLRMSRQVDARTWVFEADDAPAAIRAAAQLSGQSGVEVAAPTVRRPSLRRHYPYAAAPNDFYYGRQFALETAAPNDPFVPSGPDLNARGAWAYTRGEGVIIGVGDDGIELTHPDLAANIAGPNYNFLTNVANGSPMTRTLYHGTAVAGLIAAVGNNHMGLTGVAPAARLASWVIFDEAGNLPDDAGMAALFGEANDRVWIQNHSWGNADFLFVEPRLLENLALEKAVTEGRQGRGVILVRSAGNTREADYNFNPGSGDANLDSYANDPRQIAVAAVRNDGRFASYSTPGACVLLAAPSGDFRGGFPGLITTDRVGFNGLNGVTLPDDPTSADYLVGSRLFTGTSAAAPLVAGCAALVLAVHPELGWRDVPEILALSARQTDLKDPDLRTNGAGFRISHNTGFGVPDAGAAVRLGRVWTPRPAPIVVRRLDTNSTLIPDAPVTGTTSPARYEFPVDETLLLQHVQVRVNWEHARARDLRITITSPAGTTSQLLRPGSAAEPVPADWTFLSVLHLGESSRGMWTVDFTDTAAGVEGHLDEVELILTGTTLTDTDADGLDDTWEQNAFGSLALGPRDDPDADGWNNAAEQLAGSDPAVNQTPLTAVLTVSPGERPRLTWPAVSGAQFEIWTAPDAGQPFALLTNAPGRFPETGWFLPADASSRLLEIRTAP